MPCVAERMAGAYTCCRCMAVYSEPFASVVPTAGSSKIDDTQKEALRAQLAGRTGDTDSEPEDDNMEDV